MLPCGRSPSATCTMNDGDRRRGLHRIQREVRLLARRDRDDHRFTDGARNAEHVRRDDAGQCRGHHDGQCVAKTRGAHRVRAFAQVIGTARIASSATELMYGVIMMPMTMPGPSMLKPGRSGRIFCSIGVTEQQREIAEHDGRHADQQLEQRFDEFAHAVRRKLAEVDRDDRYPAAPRRAVRSPTSPAFRRATVQCRSASPRT